jgi:uncharacterized membrane protein
LARLTPPGRARRVRAAVALATLAALGGLALVGLLPGTAQAKSYDHPRIEQTIRLLPNGDAEVEDVRTYRFDGSYSWADLHLKETSGQYGDYAVTFEGVTDADTGEEIPSEISHEGDEAILRWNFQAQDTTRRFRLRYYIRGAVQRYDDVAQLYWKTIEDQHAPIDQLQVTVVPPAPSPNLFKVFVHSQARPGELAIAPDFSQATVSQADIPGTSFVELRALMDPALFPEATERGGESQASLLADETRQAEGTLRAGLLDAGRVAVTLFLMAALALGYLWTYWRFGREPKLAYEAIYEREPPRDMPPAVLPAILTQGGVEVGQLPRAFVATLLEAGRLGFVSFTEGQSEGMLGSGLFRKPTMTLRLTPKGQALLGGEAVAPGRRERSLEPFELAVLHAAFEEAGDGQTVTSEQIEDWGKGVVGNMTRFLVFVGPWGKQLRAWFEAQAFALDDPASERAKRIFFALALGAGIVFFFVAPNFLRFVAIGLAVVLIFLSLKALSRRTPEAALEVRRWENFKKYMTDFSALKEAGPQLLVLWEYYLVYATALGVAEKLLQNVRLVAAEVGQPLLVPGWYHSSAGGDGGAMGAASMASMESFTGSLSNFANLSSALSTSTSSGGGFSGGGGGGGGGGSSGAG